MGRDWEALMFDELFQPLGMISCEFHLSNDDIIKVKQPLQHQKVGRNFKPLLANEQPGLGPGDSIYCTMADYLKFARAHIDGFLGRNTNVLPGTSFRKLHEMAPSQSYTFGGWIRARPPWTSSQALYHQGVVRCGDRRSIVDSYSVVWVVPESELAIIAVTNSGDIDYGARVTDEVVRSVVDLLP
jgi:CubicO group peptidase (beta-lactamase class C family)